jgi:competence protein ComGC
MECHGSNAALVGSTRNAFSVLELPITIGIITILCALLLPGLNNARERAKKVRCEGVLRQVYVTTMLYASDHEDHMPSSLARRR